MDTSGPLPGRIETRAAARETDLAQPLAHRADIDGLRAVAVTLVVAFHCGMPGLPGGFIGVDVFFVISGFLIGGLIHKEAIAGRFSYANFYARRIRRIAPALIALVLATSAAALLLLSPRELADFSTHAVGALLSVPNIVFLLSTNYFADSAELHPLLMSWSLGVEEQFYILFPPLLLLMLRRKWPLLTLIALACAASFALNVWATGARPSLAFYALPPRAWELGCGVLLALWQATRAPAPLPFAVRQMLALLGLLMIVSAALLFTPRMAFPGYAALLPVAGTLLVIGNGGPVNQLTLTARPLVFVGLLSYSWYLWHWPLLSFARIASDLPLAWEKAALVSLLALALAYLSYRFVETPFRRGWQHTSARRVIVIYLIVTAVCTAALALLRASDGLPGRVSEAVHRVEAEVASSRSNPCLMGYGATGFNPDPACVGAGRGLALVGDSHASALRAGMDDYARRKGLGGVVQLSKSSCPALMGVTRAMNRHPRHASECTAFTQAAFDHVLASADVRVVVLAGFWSAPVDDAAPGQGYRRLGEPAPLTRAAELEILGQGLHRTTDALLRAGKQVIVIDDAPLLPFDAARKLINERMPLRRALAHELLAGAAPAGEMALLNTQSDDDVRAAVRVSVPAAQLFSVRDQLCAQGSCRIAADGLPLLTDQHHLSNHGARFVTRTMP